jgi:hypothetical protein
MSTYELEVRVNGKDITKYYHEQHVFVAGKDKSSYTLRFKNNSPNRILAVVSVDGLSIIDGEPASFESSGYVVDPYSMVDIKGWRLNNDEVAKFIFGKKCDSYATKSEGATNAGVIGVAVFLEKNITWISSNWTSNNIELNCPRISHDYRTAFFNYTPGATSPLNTITITDAPVECSASLYGTFPSIYNMYSEEQLTSGSMGTSFGQLEINKVNMVSFEKRDTPCEVIELHYDSMEELIRKGIVVKRPAANIARPFPAEKSVNFCKPPKGWNSIPRKIH